MRYAITVLALMTACVTLAHAGTGPVGPAIYLAAAQSDSAGAAQSATAQKAPAGILPATMQPNTLYYVLGDSLVKVEETPIEGAATVGAGAVAGAVFGLGGNPKSWIVVAGKASELPIAEAQPRFRLMTERSVALAVRLGQFEVKGEKRRAQVEPGKLDVFKKKVPLTVNKLAEGVYEFVPEKPLKPGEYALAVGYGPPVADFTVVEQEGASGKE